MMQEKLEALRAVLALAKAGWTSREGNVSLPPPFDVVQRVIDDQLVDFRRQIGFKIGAADHEEIRGSSQHLHRWASGIFGGDERDRCCCRAARSRRSAQQSRREFASTVSATRTGDAALSKSENTAEVQLSSCPGVQPIQPGAPSRHEASLQAETLCGLGQVARPRGIDRRSRDGGRAACRRASVTLTPSSGDVEISERIAHGLKLPRRDALRALCLTTPFRRRLRTLPPSSRYDPNKRRSQNTGSCRVVVT
jgi:hypothetical protein